MENEDPPSQPSTDQAAVVNFSLTPDQARYINARLPLQYSLQLVVATFRKDSRDGEDALAKQ